MRRLLNGSRTTSLTGSQGPGQFRRVLAECAPAHMSGWSSRSILFPITLMHRGHGNDDADEQGPTIPGEALRVGNPRPRGAAPGKLKMDLGMYERLPQA